MLNWVEENADRCDVIHGHEWGGAFVDLITANNYRQARWLHQALHNSVLLVMPYPGILLESFRHGCQVQRSVFSPALLPCRPRASESLVPDERAAM